MTTGASEAEIAQRGYLQGLYAALVLDPFDGKKAENFLLSEINGGSSDRPYRFLVLHKGIFPRRTRRAGRAFWLWLAHCWEGFDSIPHAMYCSEFAKWRGEWSPQSLKAPDFESFRQLPDTLTVYRGQDRAAQTGLSWTRSKWVAEGFAYGHRGLTNRNPIVLEACISKSDIALVFTGRAEDEIVLFGPPQRSCGEA